MSRYGLQMVGSRASVLRGALIVAAVFAMGFKAPKYDPAALGEAASASQARQHYSAYLQENFKLKPSPQSFDNKALDARATRFTYRSGAYELAAWLAFPEGVTMETLTAPGGAQKAVVYQHGGFAVGAGDFDDAQAFVDAGYVVMMPASRGENGNPGGFEYLLGEVDDFINAGAAMAALPGVDKTQVFGFGHSIGCGIALSAAADDGALRPYRALGGSGGVYPKGVFASFQPERGRNGDTGADIRYGGEKPLYTEVFAYAGDQEAGIIVEAAARADWHAANDNDGGPDSKAFHFETRPGDHFTALGAAVGAFIERISALDSAAD